MANLYDDNLGKCEIDSSTLIPVVDDNYFNSRSVYEKCKCIDKMKSSLEILIKSKPEKYNAYLELYNKKYSQNDCANVFKNYIATNMQDIYESGTKADKIRIESNSIKQRNNKIYFSISIFIVAIGIITIFGTRNN